jgi:formate dehydrogenase major subunit
LGASFGRGGATTFQQDLQNADCIVIQGSNMAECHPVGFQWVMEAKARGATIIHIDPRFTRTSAMADFHVPLRAGSDIAFLGGIIKYILDNEKYFPEYVINYTNAATIVNEDFVDTEQLDGLFSGYNPKTGAYDNTSWSYEGMDEAPAAGRRVFRAGREASEPGGHELGGRGASLDHSVVQRDETLQDPFCVFQILKRHYARYTPEMVERICGVSPAQFARVCEAVTANSGRERTTAWVYSVGWTQHSVGVQYIRGAAIIQLLLGNMGRPGGGILALRGHASIQGSTDIPTLFDLLPGYLPMPRAGVHANLGQYLASIKSDGQKGFWTAADAYTVSLLKAWFGDAATKDNDFGFNWLPRISGDHGTYQTTLDMLDGKVEGYFLLGQNPAVGSANGKLQRQAMSHLKWLVVRDFSLIESATFWKDGPEIATGEMRSEDIGTEVFFLPPAAHTEKSGSFTQTQRMLQWHHKAVEPSGDCRSDLQFFYELGKLLRERRATSTLERDAPLRHLTWDYPEIEGGEPDAEAVLREVNGRHLTGEKQGQLLSTFVDMKADGSTAGGCWIYTGVYTDGVNQSARRKPGSEQSWVAPEWGWAWPMNRRILYNRASADPDGKPWSERKAYVWWDENAKRWTGHDVPDFQVTKAPSFRPEAGVGGPDGLAGDDPFIMQSDGKGWLYAPSGLLDGPLPAHYEPHESPLRNAMYTQQANPTREVFPREENLTNPSFPEPGSEVFPFVVTTYRLTEHHTAGGMSRWLPYLAELQPEFFCEVSPQLATERGLVHMGWATIVTARTAIEARVMVTDRVVPLTVGGRVIHQIGLPYHWGVGGGGAMVSGDSANDVLGVALDANVLIQESKAASCDIQPGRRPTGPALVRFVEEYRRRAGIGSDIGAERSKADEGET